MSIFNNPYFIVHFFNQNQPRRPMTIYHLLRGKRTVSVLHLAEEYGLLRYFYTVPELDKKKYNQLVDTCVKRQILMQKDDGLILTKIGQEKKAVLAIGLSDDDGINGWKYGQMMNQFYRKFIFLNQIVSELSYKNKHFEPVERDKNLQLWLKNWLRNQNRETLSSCIAKEIQQLLTQLTDTEATIIVLGMTGHRLYGFTTNQLAEGLHKDPVEIEWLRMKAIHKILTEILAQKIQYPICCSLLPLNEETHEVLNKSAGHTKKMLLQGHTINEIVSLRGLKESTIVDHLIEIAMTDSYFKIDPFIEKTIAQSLAEILKTSSDLSIKAIKERLPEASFLAIRLMQIKERRKKHDKT